MAFDLQAIIQAAEQRERDLTAAARQVLEAVGTEAIDWAQVNAPWQDQTGDARRELAAIPDHPQDGGLVHLSHGVPYGKFLELAHGSRYQILQSALAQFGPELAQKLKDLTQ